MMNMKHTIEELKREIIGWMYHSLPRGKTIPIFEDMVNSLLEANTADTLERVREIHKRWEGKADSQLLGELEKLLTPTLLPESKEQPSFYRTIVDSPQWQAWIKKNEEFPQWDVYESMALGLISEGHFQAFIEFCKTYEQHV